MADDELVEIRCRGCHQYLGMGPRYFRIYCDSWCAGDFAAFPYEGRDALMEAIFQTVDITKADLAKQFDISRQRVEQILTSRVIA